VDRDGTWVAPNHVLALVYDYLVETRGWNLPAARSVATSELVDAAAKARGQKTYQTPVGFKYIGQLIREDKIALGGEESSGLTIRGMCRRRMDSCVFAGCGDDGGAGTSIHEQVMALFKKLGREYWPVRENLHLTEEQKASAIENRRAML